MISLFFLILTAVFFGFNFLLIERAYLELSSYKYYLLILISISVILLLINSSYAHLSWHLLGYGFYGLFNRLIQTIIEKNSPMGVIDVRFRSLKMIPHLLNFMLSGLLSVTILGLLFPEFFQ